MVRKKELSTALIAIAIDAEAANQLIVKAKENAETSSARIDLASLLNYTRNGTERGWLHLLLDSIQPLCQPDSSAQHWNFEALKTLAVFLEWVPLM